MEHLAAGLSVRVVTSDHLAFAREVRLRQVVEVQEAGLGEGRSGQAMTVPAHENSNTSCEDVSPAHVARGPARPASILSVVGITSHAAARDTHTTLN